MEKNKRKPRQAIKRKPKGNRKVKNATPTEMDGIKFRSKLELFMYRKLKEAGIEADYEEHVFTLIEKFQYKDEKVRAMTFKPDFVNTDLNFIIEVKGFANDAFPLRWKIFKALMVSECENEEELPNLYLPRNQRDCLEVVEQILRKNEERKQDT